VRTMDTETDSQVDQDKPDRHRVPSHRSPACSCRYTHESTTLGPCWSDVKPPTKPMANGDWGTFA